MSDYMSTEYTVLSTELGRLLLWSNGRRVLDDGTVVDVFGVRTEHAHNMPPRGSNLTADDVDSVVTVNRVDWHFHGFGQIDPDTGTVVKMGDRGSYDARRADYKEAGWESRTKAETKIYAAIQPALEAFAQSDEGRAFLSRARYREASNDLLQVVREVADLDAQREQLETKRAALESVMRENVKP